ncbi:MAG: hypothetical protein JO244_09955 [Solirubrobacterales bacterium]|nr:hypothetical protein [Solirubrobacterales bacterium]
MDRYGPKDGLPPARSVHNGFWYWGPPAGSAPALLIGFDPGQVGRLCADPTLSSLLDNHLHISDDEQGAPVWVCSHPRHRWASVWRSLRVLG